jgi:hypothetical protein
MPLKRGSSRRIIADNIRELMRTYQREGRIGRSRPATSKKAVSQAAAIAYRVAGETGEAPVPPKPADRSD